jgi:large subunit ribosomal protein L29
MKGKEVKALRDEQIEAELRAIREKHFGLRQQRVTEKVSDVSQFSKLRRDVARLLGERQARAIKAGKVKSRRRRAAERARNHV